MITHHIIEEIIGWYGATAILVGYGLLTFGILSPLDVSYHLINISGAAGIIYISVVRKAWPPAGLNIAYIVVALFGIAQIVF